MNRKILSILFILCLLGGNIAAQVADKSTPLPLKRMLKQPCLRAASVALMAVDVESGEVRYSYEAERGLTPASILKCVTTATALEVLGADYRYPTSLQYDGNISNGTLNGNLFIKGSGDPTLGSSHLTAAEADFSSRWIESLKAAGIRRISGAVVADESIFDTEGVSTKWLREDLGSYYGAGSYGLSAFDNRYQLFLKTGAAGSRPTIVGTKPTQYKLRFHNYLTAASVTSDSSYIIGMPFAEERYLYGILPAGRERVVLEGDLPDPPLFLAEWLTERLRGAGIEVEGVPSCHRIAAEAGNWPTGLRQTLVTTYSPPLAEIVRITNHVSHNLYADALIKTIGLSYQPAPGEVISSFDRGVRVVEEHWKEKGMNMTGFNIVDGSGLAASDKVTALLMAQILAYMATRSGASACFQASLPAVGQDGSVRNFLKGSPLQGHARLKSGSMSGVRCYVGYITKGEKRYAMALLVNNYSCNGRSVKAAIEQLLLSLF